MGIMYATVRRLYMACLLYTSARTPVTKHAFGGFTSGPELSWIGEDGLEAVIPPVSYTHLDVYKRQGLQCVDIPLGQNFSLRQIKPISSW